MRKYIWGLILMSFFACTTQKNITYNPISKKLFLEKPFGFNESIKNFSSQAKPKFKTQKLLRKNKHYPEKTDTIYKFHYKKSEIFFYRTYSGKEFLLAGKVLNKQIKFTNDIHPGITKNEFSTRFSEKLNLETDSLHMIGEGTKYTFIFRNDKLFRINIDNYFD